MSETKRTAAEIKSEYTNLAFKAGNTQYAIAENQRDLAMINTQMRDLSLEYTAATNAEAEAAKTETPKQADASHDKETV